MKRSLITWLLIAAVAVVCIIGIGIFVHSTSEDMTYEETYLYGDRAEAEGVNITGEFFEKGALCWNADITLGKKDSEPEVHANFKYRKAYTDSRPAYQGRLFIVARCLDSCDEMVNDTDSPTRMPDDEMQVKMIEDAASRTMAGKRHTELLKFSDYCRYVPLFLSISETFLDLRDFVKIPMPDSVLIELTVEKDSRGKLIAYKFSPCTIETYADSTDMQNGISYLVFNGLEYKTDSKNPAVKNVKIPVPDDLKGIYRIEKSGIFITKDDVKQSRKLCTLQGTEKLPHIVPGADNSRLYFSYINEQGRWLRIIDTDTGEEKQHILLDHDLSISEKDLWLSEAREKDNNVFIRLNDEKTFFLLTPSGSSFTIAMTGKIDNVGETTTRYNEEKINLFDIRDFDYNGKKLAVITTTEEALPDAYMYLFMFSKNELQYEGMIYPSAANDMMHCTPTKHPITVTLPKG